MGYGKVAISQCCLNKTVVQALHWLCEMINCRMELASPQGRLNAIPTLTIAGIFNSLAREFVHRVVNTS